MEDNFNIFAVLSKRMDWLSQRQKVLADNIANADTPNFQPRDLRADEFRRVLTLEQRAAQNAGHDQSKQNPKEIDPPENGRLQTAWEERRDEQQRPGDGP